MKEKYLTTVRVSTPSLSRQYESQLPVHPDSTDMTITESGGDWLRQCHMRSQMSPQSNLEIFPLPFSFSAACFFFNHHNDWSNAIVH